MRNGLRSHPHFPGCGPRTGPKIRAGLVTACLFGSFSNELCTKWLNLPPRTSRPGAASTSLITFSRPLLAFVAPIVISSRRPPSPRSPQSRCLKRAVLCSSDWVDSAHWRSCFAPPPVSRCSVRLHAPWPISGAHLRRLSPLSPLRGAPRHTVPFGRATHLPDPFWVSISRRWAPLAPCTIFEYGKRQPTPGRAMAQTRSEHLS
mmetsp:Transcript_16828/g.39957  ORF Transcript_16828/g.39957 Transcript_16828/m.39957 type:complete len:204 (-) Transcript_16828:237-848(-)